MSMEATDRSSALGQPVRRIHLLAAVLLLILFLLRVAAIFTENVNWDEFALMTRVLKTQQSGRMAAGGRPGLAVLMLLPVASRCDNEVTVVQHARILWTLVTAVYLWGLFVLLKRVFGQSPHATTDALLAVACLALVPPFLRWSIQVRTDQAALAFSVWAGVALVASGQRRAWALVGGVLTAAGYLCSQKALYLVPLLGILVLFDLLLRRPRPISLVLQRGALFVVGAAAAYLAYGSILPLFLVPPTTATFESVASVFDFYRQAVGYSHYRGIAPFLLPHAVLLLLSVVCGFLVRWRCPTPDARRHVIHLISAWSILLLGVGVALFHAAAFYYFWMTLGLFLAVAIGLVQEPIRNLLLMRPRSRTVLLVALWSALVAPGLYAMGHLLRDTQSFQQTSFDFVRRSFSRDDVGFHPEGALFCQRDPQPFRTYLSQQIRFNFYGKDAGRNTRQLVSDFVHKPVKFILDSWRLRLFPPAIQKFWFDNYQPYWGSIWIPRRRISGRRGIPFATEILIPGRYRWIPSSPVRLAIDGVTLDPGGTIKLTAGRHTVTPIGADGNGLLVYAVKTPPAPARVPFYKPFAPW